MLMLSSNRPSMPSTVLNLARHKLPMQAQRQAIGQRQLAHGPVSQGARLKHRQGGAATGAVQRGAQHPTRLRLGGVGARHIQVFFGNPVRALAVGLRLLARHGQHAVGPIALAQAGRAGLHQHRQRRGFAGILKST